MCICIAIFITPIAATSQEGGTISSWIEHQKLTNVDIHFTASIPENSVAALVVYRDKCALRSYSEVCEASIITAVDGVIQKLDLHNKVPINRINFEVVNINTYGYDNTAIVMLEFNDLRDHRKYYTLWSYINTIKTYMCPSQYCPIFSSENFQCSGTFCTAESRIGGDADDSYISKWSANYGLSMEIELLRFTGNTRWKIYGMLLKNTDWVFNRITPNGGRDCTDDRCFSYVVASRGGPYGGAATVFFGASVFNNNCEASVSCFENSRNEEICQFECGAVRLGVSADTLIVEK